MAQTPSIVTESWNNGDYVLTVKHNGPLDVSIKCSGNETGRSATYKRSSPKVPSFPDFYKGERQYEGENFDMKNIEENVTNGCRTDVTKFQGMGFLKLGIKDSAAIKDTVKTNKAGTFKWTLRYSSTSDVNSIDLYVNGSKIKTLSLPKGANYSDWKTISENIELKSGENKIELKANSAAPCSVYLDNFKVAGDFGGSTVTPIEPINGTLIKELIVNDRDNAANWSIYNNTGVGSLIYGDRDITFASFPENLVGAETIKTACDSKMYTSDLGEFTAGADITVYVAVDERVAENIQSWLGNWKNAGVSVSSSNDVTFILYKKNVKSGEKVTLGTNGGFGLSANYSVFAVPQEKIIKGDLNSDGCVDVFDMCLARMGVTDGFNNTLAFDAADIDSNGKVEASDLVKLQKFLLGMIKQF